MPLPDHTTDPQRPPHGVLLIGFERAEAERLSAALAQGGHRAYPAGNAREAASVLDAAEVGLALADLEGPFTEVLGAIDTIRTGGRRRCPLLGVGSVTAGTAMVDVLRALGLAGLIPGDATPQELIFRVNAALYAAGQRAARMSPRVPVDMAGSVEGPAGSVDGRILNLSATGLFFAAERVLPVNTIAVARFALDKRREPIEVRCRIVWASHRGDGQRYFEGMGLELLSMPAAARTALDDFLTEALATLEQTTAR